MFRVSALLVASLVAGLLTATAAAATEPVDADVKWSVHCAYVDKPQGSGTVKVCAPLPIG